MIFKKLAGFLPLDVLTFQKLRPFAWINQRLKEKVEQTKKSDNFNIPAFIVVVEFSQPIIKVKKR